MEALIKRHLNRMQTVKLDFVRSMMDEIDWNDRLLMIKGQKGVGKTTLMTQRILQEFGPTNTTDVLYASLDNIYFSTHSLLDFIERFHAQGGKYLFLDDPQVCQEGSHFFVLIIIKNKTICQSVLNVVVN